jgi:hypothetical protein
VEINALHQEIFSDSSIITTRVSFCHNSGKPLILYFKVVNFEVCAHLLQADPNVTTGYYDAIRFADISACNPKIFA